MHENLVAQVRPTSLFSSYRPQTESQKVALSNLAALSGAIMRKAEDMLTLPHPFDHGRIIFVSGAPGVGKTHLVEALVNEVVGAEEGLAKRIFLFRGNLNAYFAARIADFGGCPVVVIDDLFSEFQSLDKLHPIPDMRTVMELVTMVYDERRLLIVTSNFPMMQGLFARLGEIDTVGRAKSRLRELMASSGEIQIEGPDYRETLAAERSSADIFGDL